jgi:hypothetical protein
MASRAIRVCAPPLVLAALYGGTAVAQNNLNDLGAVAPGLAINDNGQVVLQGYLYSGGTLTTFPAGFTGTSINSSGVVVGSLAGTNTPPAPSSCPTVGLDAGGDCAFATYSNGAVASYPIYQSSIFGTAAGNQAQGINDSGEIVGDWTSGEGLGGAILLNNGAVTTLIYPTSGCTGGLSAPAGVAYAINDAGQVAGLLPIGSVDTCPGDAFLLSQGNYTDIGPGAALALNATGQVVGYLYFGSPPNGGGLGSPLHAFLYSDSSGTAAQDLGTLPGDTDSFAYAINSSAFIVGYSLNANPLPNGTKTAFFYNGVMNNLNSFVAASDPLKAYVKLTDARGINHSGLIVVNGVDSRTQAQHTYLLQVPLIRVAPGPLTFPGTPIGGSSSPQTLTFTNAGATAIALGNASATDGYTIQSNNCGATLTSAATCMISVVYAPTSGTNTTGTLVLPAAGASIAVPVSGAATAATQSSSSGSRGDGGSGGGGLEPLSLLSLLGTLIARRQRAERTPAASGCLGAALAARRGWR